MKSGAHAGPAADQDRTLRKGILPLWAVYGIALSILAPYGPSTVATYALAARRHMHDYGTTAFLGFERTLTGPVYPGDTVRARWTVSQVRRSRSRPERGVACLSVAVVKQDGAVVQRGSDTYLVAARPHIPASRT
jgi:hypothetical protein